MSDLTPAERIAAQAPPLTDEQRARLAALLTSGAGGGTR